MPKITSDVVAATNEFRKTVGMPPLNVAAYPVPAVQDDPSIRTAIAAKQAFAEQAATIRRNDTYSDAHKAALIATAWHDTLAQLTSLSADFNTRRQVRWDHLQTQIPTGPDIPERTSAIERAQLLQLFQAAVEKARSSSADELAKIYTDARRFGDELSERAVFVVAHSEGRGGNIVRQYVTDHPELADALAELDELRAPAGRGFITQALAVGPMGRFVEPAEVRVAAQQAARDAAAGNAPVGVP